jgi:Fe-S oxidoreductase
VASACPFCNTMLTDGVKAAEKETDVKVMDIAELVAASL